GTSLFQPLFADFPVDSCGKFRFVPVFVTSMPRGYTTTLSHGNISYTFSASSSYPEGLNSPNGFKT
ncbi:hypothetical protein, partial [Alicyclobacillus fodiniaquatilis]